MNEAAPKIEIFKPFGEAFELMNKILFQPFDVGTVILLPVYVCVRAFGLLFLRQFGPDYDVWATLPPPESPPISLASPV